MERALRAGIAAVGAVAVCVAVSPVAVTAAAVVALAGPHAAIEVRYALARIPGRFGPLARFFAVAFAGILALTAAMIALTLTASTLTPEQHGRAYAAWLTAAILWTGWLAAERARTPPRRAWGDLAPCLLGALGVAWCAPVESMIALVYLHPLVSLAVLDREIARTRPAALPAYRAALAVVPAAVFAVVLVVALRGAGAGGIAGSALGTRAIAQSGAAWLPFANPRVLVAVHGLLEILHYLAWLVAIPLASTPASGRVLPIPLERRSPPARRAVRRLLALSLAGVAALWIGFGVNPGATWDLYFTLAISHVLAEIPMLLRLL